VERGGHLGVRRWQCTEDTIKISEHEKYLQSAVRRLEIGCDGKGFEVFGDAGLDQNFERERTPDNIPV
jgi:hypothetical protein